jgi:hypothetical protein
MAEFKRSRLEKKKNEQITKKTVFLGFLTVIVLVLVLVFGLPLLIKFSVFLGEGKLKNSDQTKEKVLAPLAPRLVIPFEATNSAEIKISGFAEPKVTVELFKGEVSVGKTEVTDSGDFIFSKVVLDEGDNGFNAVASTDEAGSGDGSKTINVVYDKTSPKLEMSNPSEESLSVDSADFDITGITDSGASVSINNRIAPVDNNGGFKLKWQLNMGKNDLEITSTDLAGNQTKKKISITYSL